jgi:prephenate dehydrogenase
VWRDICLMNAEAVGEALEQLIDRLVDLRADLRRGEVIDQVFTGAARWRGELMKGRE